MSAPDWPRLANALLVAGRVRPDGEIQLTDNQVFRKRFRD
jgi:hypothetical protein